MDYNNGKGPKDFKMTVEIKVGDIVRLCKAHPCGSYEWEVVRVGADIGLKCQRRVKNVVAKSD